MIIGRGGRAAGTHGHDMEVPAAVFVHLGLPRGESDEVARVHCRGGGVGSEMRIVERVWRARTIAEGDF